MLALLSLLALLPCLLYAAILPLSLDGALDSATVDSSAYNTGGTISVNGVSIKVPKNLQFQLPAAWVPFKDIAAGGFIGSEVTVYGNFVDGVAIAGIVQLAEFALEANTGVIASLGFDGKITMVGGQVVRINDPNAIYSAGYTAKPAFTADDVNPSISAFSGFPMCVPRSADDAKCPASNRPAGRTSFNAPDPLTMAPFLVGDFLEFEGIRVGSELIAYGVVAPSVQILTTGSPTYLRVEDAIIGLFDGQPAGNVEWAESRFVGYTSDSSVSVAITRSEIDPCTGKITDVSVGAATPRAGDVRNKWIWRADSTTKVNYAREYKVTASNGVKATNNGEIVAGQYITPIGDWIFPEIALPGAFPGMNDFSQFTHLTRGIGPDAEGNIWGPLEPFPDGTTITAKTCSAAPSPTDTGTPTSPATAAPVANAGPDIATRPGVSVALVGKAENASTFPSGDLSYSWKQSAGPIITLANSAAASASFTAPNVTAVTNCTFSLTVSSKASGLNTSDLVIVTIDPKALDSVVIDSYTWTSSGGGTISVTAHSNVIDGAARLSMVLLNPNAGAAITMVNAGSGKFTYSAKSVKKPSNGLTVSSNFGGKQTIVATTSRRRSRMMRALKIG